MVRLDYDSVSAMNSERNSPPSGTAIGRTNRHRRKGTPNGMRSLSGLTETILAPALRGRVNILAKLITHWPELAGEVAGWSQPVDIQFSGKKRSDGVLVLSIRSGTGPQTQMMSTYLCDSVNQLAGYAMVSRIRLIQNLSADTDNLAESASLAEAPVIDEATQSKLEQKLSQVNSPELRAALLKLGQAVHNGQKTD